MLKTPLFNEHQKLKAKISEFAGYQMPIFYTSVKEEYLAVRNNAGIFDISHMCPIFIKSENSKEDIINFLEPVTCRMISSILPNQVQYNALLNENGGIIDDITVFYLAENKYMLIVNASNSSKVMEFLRKEKEKKQCKVEIKKPQEYILLAVQGPDSEKLTIDLLKKEGISLPDIFYYECFENSAANSVEVISRTGYTGEDGFEILLSVEKGLSLWQNALKSGIKPAGLASRDILRMEMFYPLYGHEIDETTSPYEGGIGWLVDEKDMPLAPVLQQRKESSQKVVRGFHMIKDGIPRSGFEVYDENDNLIGQVTSGAFSFLTNKGFGMASIKKTHAKTGSRIFINTRQGKKEASVLIKSSHKGSIKRRK
ncbi:MAG: glycine cleavage system aminomethyltransferase GcvT [Spirochaetia bacterium]|nr:glycine cleavage system aminomethyltransferase GcvT [Spirochaetia bacterium]